jgi:hypothetical protein
MELPVDITADCDGCADGLNVTLFDKDLLDFFAEDSEVSFGEDTATLDSAKPLIDVDVRSHLFLVVIKVIIIVFLLYCI